MSSISKTFTQSRGNALGFAPVSNITQQSPAQPRAPPNTPSTLIARTRAAKMEEQRRALSLTPIVHAPSSPQSPDLQPRTRSVSLQHPRSIPLTQLIQRRLSSVQEEDSGPPIDMSSPSGSPPQRSRSLSTGETPTSARKLGVSRLSNPPTTRHLDTVLPSMGSSQGPVQAQNYRQRSTRSDPIANDATKFTQPHSTTKGRTGGPHGRPTIVNTGRENPALTYGSNKDFSSRERGRGRGRGRRGGRGTSVPVRVNGPERVDGGMTVRC
ncbi:hypothetical protein QCA50_009542 [Cerrena zonata]|uniref:Uncharacterized protein n=1 Tax=Cerrena zonata TaxID=2478898 RepID=A0AAW0GAV7_9APHY